MVDRHTIVPPGRPDDAANERQLTFGEVLRRLRRDAGLSQEALAERANLSWRTISDLERGINRRPQQETRRLLADALGLSPTDRAAFEAAARGERTVSLSLVTATTPAPVHAIPTPMTPLVGRTDEVQTVCALLQGDDLRLLTITGPGGVGKTRIALAVAARVGEDFPDGLWFVPFAAVRDPALAASAIAQAIGVREHVGQTVVAALHARLRSLAALLVLDNFEQLTAAATTIADLLAACPRLRVLITSRAALRIYGEHEYPLSPLLVPNPDGDAQIVARSAAVELFRQRAAAVRPGFAISPANAASVAAICAALDGLPLAIELAAARTRLFAPADLLTRLTAATGDARLTILTGGARDAPRRQQTMRDTIAWSYDLLSPAEQRLFRRLAVFIGGWTLDAAAAICGDGDAMTFEDGIAVLIDQSLVRTQEGATGEVRFAMLETIRAFGWQQLMARDDAMTVRERHGDWFLAFAEQAQAELTGPQQVTWIVRLMEEHDNLRAALTTARERGAIALGLRLGIALAPFWNRHGHYSEGRAWLETFLPGAETAADGSPLLLARALNATGMLAAAQGETERAQAMHTRARHLAGEVGDIAEQATAIMHLGRTAEMRGEFDQSVALLADAIAHYRQIGDERGVAAALIALGTAQRRQGGYGQARATYEESLALYRRQGDQRGVAQSLFNLGTTAYHLNELARAVTLLGQGMAVYQEMDEKPGVAICLGNLGLVAWKQQDYPRAMALQEQALAIQREIGNKRGMANDLNNLGLIANRLGDLARAEELHTESLDLRREMGDIWGISMSLNNLGSVAAAHGDHPRAIALCEEGLALRRAHGHQQGIAESTYHLGLIVQQYGDRVRAVALFRESLSIYRAMRASTHIAGCLIALGDLASSDGADVRAIQLCAAGTALYAAIAMPISPDAQAAAERIRAAAQARLNPAAFAAAWDRGKNLPADQAIEEALVPA